MSILLEAVQVLGIGGALFCLLFLGFNFLNGDHRLAKSNPVTVNVSAPEGQLQALPAPLASAPKAGLVPPPPPGVVSSP